MLPISHRPGKSDSSLREGCGYPLQDSLVVNIHFHVGPGKGDIAYDMGRELTFRIIQSSKLLFYVTELFANFAGFSGIAEEQIMQLLGIGSNISGSLPAGYTLCS